MSEYFIIIIALIASIGILSSIDSILRVIKTNDYYKATLNLLLSCSLFIILFIIIYFQTGVKLFY